MCDKLERSLLNFTKPFNRDLAHFNWRIYEENKSVHFSNLSPHYLQLNIFLQLCLKRECQSIIYSIDRLRQTEFIKEDLWKTIFKIFFLFTFKIKIFLFPLSYLAEICIYFLQRTAFSTKNSVHAHSFVFIFNPWTAKLLVHTVIICKE